MPGDGHLFARGVDLPVAASARGSVITTVDGVEYLDGAGGALASSIGHGRREVVDAMSAQAAAVDYVHATQFTTESAERFAGRVAAVVPVDGARVFPVSGGSEANETALKLARAFHLANGDADRHVIVARVGAYHGNSRGALDASDRLGLRAGYEPWLGQTERVPAVNPLRDGRSGVEHAEALAETIDRVGAERVAAFIAEPVSGATLGAVVPPDDYWPAVARVCHERGVLLIADEVMTGFGRTGRWFGVDHWGVRPDLVTAGKGASSGYWPLGLCVASGPVYEAVVDVFAHGFTWSHHPVGSAVGEAVLDVIEAESLVDNAAVVGDQIRARLREELGTHPNVAEVRGLGMLTGVEFVADRSTLEPFPRSEGVCERVVRACLDRRMTVYPCTSAVDGRVGDAVLLGPPLSVSVADADAMVDRLIDAIRSVLSPA